MSFGRTALACSAAPVAVLQEPHDHFVVKNGIRCAGVHLIVDLYDATQLDDIDHIKSALRRSVDAAGATLLHVHLHHFEPNGGVSGVAVLAESHISIHTWPERGYAAIDIFMCGQAKPETCVPICGKPSARSRPPSTSCCAEPGRKRRGLGVRDSGHEFFFAAVPVR